MFPGGIYERSHIDTGGVHPNQEFTDPSMLRGIRVGASNQIGIVSNMGEAGPDFLAVQGIVIALLVCPGLERSQVRAGAGLTHPQTKDDLTLTDLGQDFLFLLFTAIGQQRRTNLTIPQPVGRDRGSGTQQFFGQDQAVKIRFFLTAVLLGPGQPDPALPAKFLRKLTRVAANPAVFNPGLSWHLARQEFPDFRAKGFLFFGEGKIHTVSLD